MAITFTDTQIRTISKQILDAPSQLSTIAQQQVTNTQNQADALNKDNANKVFYDNYKSIIAAYNGEQEALNGGIITLYDDSTLIDSAKQTPTNLHFPFTPVWTNLIPKILDVNNGNPTSSNPLNESTSWAPVTTWLNYIVNGFNDGSASTTATAYISGVVTVIDTTGFSNGQRILISQGSYSLLGTITSIVTNDLHFSTIISTAGTFTNGATVKNFHAAFTTGEKEGTSTSPDAAEVLATFKSNLDSTVVTWKSYLTTQQTNLNNNSAVGSEATDNNTAKTNVNNALSDINSFQAAPAIGAGTSRYGSSYTTSLSNRISSRTSQSTTRGSQIISSLGSVSQNGQGVLSGSGQFYNLMNWISLRISKSGGTLTKYYSYDLIGTFNSQRSDNITTQGNEYSNHMVVTKLSEDTDGTDTISVDSVASFSVSDSIYLVDEGSSPTYSGTILSINGLLVQLSSVISNSFAKNDTARLVKVI